MTVPRIGHLAGLLPPGTELLRFAARLGPGGSAGPVVAIPARNEERRIVACLTSLALAARTRRGPRLRAVILVNGTNDRTWERAVAASAALGLPSLVADVRFPEASAHAGAARGAALDIAAALASPQAMLLTTDADTRVAPDWLAANAAELAAGAALVCGRIGIDPAEMPARSPAAEAAGALEGRYLDLMRRLESLVDPDPVNPWPHHGGIGGASLAMRARDYRAAGGLPRLAVGEDRALAAAFRDRDLPVRHSDAARVVTSGRMAGRAPGGMADALRRRATIPDAPVDAMAERAGAWHARLRTRALARRLHAAGEGLDLLARDLGLSPFETAGILASPTFGRAWSLLESRSRFARRPPLRPSDLPPEIARLERLVATLTAPAPAPRARPAAARRIRPPAREPAALTL